MPQLIHNTFARILAVAMLGLVLALAIGTAAMSTAWAKPASACAGSQGASDPTGVGIADWTVLIYMASDNNLESAALNNLRAMAQVGASAHVKIVAQVDRISSPAAWDDTTADNWTGTKRFLILPGAEPDSAMSAQCLGELNTGDPTTLSDFISWGVRAYPARHYALILWSHGAAWQGLASDDTSGGDSLTLPELRAALATADAQVGYGQLDLIGFDACLMAQLDVFETIAPYARVAVASAEIEPSQGWAWEAWLRALTANPDQDAAAIAGVIVDSYTSAYQGADAITLAAFDLARVVQISAGLNDLAGALLEASPADDLRIARARTAVNASVSSAAKTFNTVDLGRLAQLLATRGATSAVVEAAEVTAIAIQQARLAYGEGQAGNTGSGISIYFPPTAAQYIYAYEYDSPLTDWAEFLKAYHHRQVA